MGVLSDASVGAKNLMVDHGQHQHRLVLVVDDLPLSHRPVLGVQPSESGRRFRFSLTSKIRCACDVAVELPPHLVIQPSRRLFNPEMDDKVRKSEYLIAPPSPRTFCTALQR